MNGKILLIDAPEGASGFCEALTRLCHTESASSPLPRLAPSDASAALVWEGEHSLETILFLRESNIPAWLCMAYGDSIPPLSGATAAVGCFVWEWDRHYGLPLEGFSVAVLDGQDDDHNARLALRGLERMRVSPYALSLVPEVF